LFVDIYFYNFLNYFILLYCNFDIDPVIVVNIFLLPINYFDFVFLCYDKTKLYLFLYLSFINLCELFVVYIVDIFGKFNFFIISFKLD
jgi:hypothetical protein